MLALIDFMAGLLAMMLATHWGDGNSTHSLLVVIAIAMASIISYGRGLAAGRR